MIQKLLNQIEILHKEKLHFRFFHLMLHEISILELHMPSAITRGVIINMERWKVPRTAELGGGNSLALLNSLSLRFITVFNSQVNSLQDE